MTDELAILMVEAMGIYLLVLLAHSIRTRFGLAHFYALLGALTAVMSWITDANVRVDVAGMSFMVGSTVFYTSLLLAVFVVYVFDGIRATRIAISTIAGVSIMVPVIAAILHLQLQLSGHSTLAYVPFPSLRINLASIGATVADLVFLAIAWEFLGKTELRMPLWLRSFLTLLGVMWLDVLLFNTAAFLGGESYLSIMSGTFVTRLVISIFAFPLLYGYLEWQNRKLGMVIENRPVLSIIKEVTNVRRELNSAQEEIKRRQEVEQQNLQLIDRLQQALAEVKTLQGFLPICANCQKIRGDEGYWERIEEYIESKSDAKFSHGICPDCADELYPGFAPDLPDQ